VDHIVVELVFDGVALGGDRLVARLGLLLVESRLAKADNLADLIASGVDADAVGLDQHGTLADGDVALVHGEAFLFLANRRTRLDLNRLVAVIRQRQGGGAGCQGGQQQCNGDNLTSAHSDCPVPGKEVDRFRW